MSATDDRVEHPRPAPGPRGHWLAGSTFDFRAHPIDFCVRTAREHGDVAAFRVAVLRWYLVSHPAHVHDVLVTRASKFKKPDLARRLWQQFLGDGLLSIDGDHWRRQQRMILPGFQRDRIEAYGDIMVRYTERMLDRFTDGETRDLCEDMTQLTCDIVVKALFDAEVDEGTPVGSHMALLNELMIEHVNTLIPRPRWWPSPSNRRKVAAVDDITRMIEGIIAARRAEGRDHGDLLSQLVLAQDEETGQGMTSKELLDEARTLFFAGHETTALAMTWLWYLLAGSPRVLETLEAELERELGERSPRVADLPALPYLEQVVKESLRMRPPVWGFMREPTEDVRLGDHVLEKGSLVFFCTYGLHHDARWWDDPEEFRPERFEKEAERMIPKGAYVPFAAGPRICIGKNFAMMEARLILATMLQRVHLSRPEGTEVPIQPMIGLRPEGGAMPMRVHRKR